MGAVLNQLPLYKYEEVMKLSKFNVLIPYKKSVIVYNTLWNSLVLVKKDSGLLDYISGKKNLNDNITDFPSVLMEKKIVHCDDFNEIEHIQTIMTNQICDKKILTLIVMPTLGCNFKCWYCYENHDVERKRMSDQDIDLIIKYIQKHIQENPVLETVVISFFGGEPFLYFKEVMKPLLVKIDEITTQNHINYLTTATTNGALVKPNYLDFLKKHHFESMQITLDGNKKRHNRVRFAYPGDNSYDVIVKNIKDSIQAGIQIYLRFNISEHTKLDVHQILGDFQDVNNKELLLFSVHKIWQSKQEVNNTVDSIVAEIRKSGYQCFSYFSTPSSIWNMCYADKDNEIIVMPGSKVYKCTARDFSKEQMEGMINDNGKIIWTEKNAKRRQTSVFNNKACMKCSIMPICIGGCRQKQIEHNDNNTCVSHMDEIAKVEYARRVFMDRLEMSHS